VNTRWWTVPGAWLAASLLWPAAAEAAGLPVRFYYRAPEGCGSAESFVAHLAVRNPEARLAWGGEPAFELTVVLEVTATEVVGTLYLTDPVGSRTVRVVPGQNCSDVVSALALVAAVLTNPHGSEVPQPSLQTSSVSPAPSPPVAKGKWWVGGGAGLGLQRAASPHLSPSPSFELVGGLETGSTLDPLLSIGLHYARSTAKKGDWTATFDWTAGRLLGCPIQWPGAMLLSFRPCAWFEVGRLAGSGRGDPPFSPRNAAVTWWAAGLLVRAEVRLLEPLTIVAEAGLVIPLLWDRFYFDPQSPDTEVFRVPPVAMDGRLGLVARVW
jgi:hypothetical protein